MTPMAWVARQDVDWRTARFIALGYLALSAFDFVFALPIARASLGVLALLTFLSGPAGFLFAFVTMPDRWALTIASSYVVTTCLLAPVLALSCHRKPRVSHPSRMVAGLVWPGVGFLAICYVFAYAA